VIATTDPTKATLTITSCHPKWTARERIVITAELDADASQGPVGEPVLNYGRPLTGPTDSTPGPTSTVVAPVTTDTTPTSNPAVGGGDDPTTGNGSATGTEAINTGIADAFSEGWFSDPTANGQVALWGTLLAAVGILSYLLSRTTRRDWVGLVVGIVPFVIVLYFFFQNVNRLLPPNL
jgi:sortase A